jgi:hypothetical protein
VPTIGIQAPPSRSYLPAPPAERPARPLGRFERRLRATGAPQHSGGPTVVADELARRCRLAAL